MKTKDQNVTALITKLDAKATQRQIRAQLEAQGIDFAEDFHTLRSDKVELLTEAAKACKYKAPEGANGSTARYFFARLARIKP